MSKDAVHFMISTALHMNDLHVSSCSPRNMTSIIALLSVSAVSARKIQLRMVGTETETKKSALGNQVRIARNPLPEAVEKAVSGCRRTLRTVIDLMYVSCRAKVSPRRPTRRLQARSRRAGYHL